MIEKTVIITNLQWDHGLTATVLFPMMKVSVILRIFAS